MLRVRPIIWQSAPSTADFCGKACAQRVHGLWRAWAWLLTTTHTPSNITLILWESSQLLHALYHFFTQALPTQFGYQTPLLQADLFTLSTRPIKTTTKYIKE
jgi:hypothetical protein